MSVRFEWMHLPHVEYVPAGYDVREGRVLPEDEWSDETTVENGALLLSADEVTVVTGDPDSLREWAQVILAALPQDDHPEHDICADGCGLDVDHDGPCLDKPDGRQVCEHS